MTQRAAFRKADLNKAAEVAKRHGLEVRVEGDVIRLLPIAANAPSDDASDMERRMREAFGE